MRSVWLALLLLGVALATQCTNGSRRGGGETTQEGQYQAPRRLGESVLSWADATSSSNSCSPEGCCEEVECDTSYLGTKDHWEALAYRARTWYDYVALLDFDYNTTPAPFKGGALHTRLEVRRIVEEFVNLLPGGKWDEILVAGTCDQNGHCIMNEGRFPMPLWSGTSLVLGFNADCAGGKVVVRVPFEVYPVEKDSLFDFFGFAYDWNEMREMLRKAGEEASKTRPEACAPQPPIPLPSQGGDASPPGEGPFPLPDL